jgi:hypothetical protein
VCSHPAAGGCPAQYQAPTFVVRNSSQVCTLAANGTAVESVLGAGSPNYACLHGRMESATMWLGIAGFCISAIMLQRRVKVGDRTGIPTTLLALCFRPAGHATGPPPPTAALHMTPEALGNQRRYNTVERPALHAPCSM